VLKLARVVLARADHPKGKRRVVSSSRRGLVAAEGDLLEGSVLLQSGLAICLHKLLLLGSGRKARAFVGYL